MTIRAKFYLFERMGFASIFIRAFINEGIKEVSKGYRENERLDLRKARLQQLGRVHVSVVQDFMKPIAAEIEQISQKDGERLNRYLVAMNERGEEHLNDKEPSEPGVSRYARSIKTAALVAMGLCKKYEIYSDIQSVRYDSARKMIVLNDQDHYSLG